MLNELHKGKE